MVNHANLTAVTHNIILIDQCAQGIHLVIWRPKAQCTDHTVSFHCKNSTIGFTYHTFRYDFLYLCIYIDICRLSTCGMSPPR